MILTPHSYGDVVGDGGHLVALCLALEDGLVVGRRHGEREDGARRDGTVLGTQRLLHMVTHVTPVALPRDTGQRVAAAGQAGHHHLYTREINDLGNPCTVQFQTQGKDWTFVFREGQTVHFRTEG